MDHVTILPFDLSKTKFRKSKTIFGEGINNYLLAPYRTIATDQTKIPLGTVLYIPEARGNKIQVGDKTIIHDGYFFVGDRGGAIKDNHIDFAGGIEKAVDTTRQYLKNNGLDLKIEIETRNLDEVKRVIAHGGVDRIMLDNFSPEKIKEALILINGKFETEASGGITLENIRGYAESGVDFISIGALTHHIKSLDLSLKFVK